MTAETANKPPRLPSLSQRELDLVRGALDQVRRISVNAPDEQAVVRMLRIRKDLARRVTMYDELREQARREVRWGFILSLFAAFLVLAFGFWRILERSEMPLNVTNDPIKFLTLFTVLFVLAWTPLIIALVHRSRLRRQADEAPKGNPEHALKVFDVTLVRGLVGMRTRPKSGVPSSSRPSI